MLGIEGLRTPEWVATEATTVALGPVGAAIIELLVVSSCTGHINGTMQASARACYTVVKSSILFGWLQYVLPKYRTPLLPVLAHFALGTVIPLRLHPSGLFFVFKRRLVVELQAVKMPGYPALPALYLLGILVLVTL